MPLGSILSTTGEKKIVCADCGLRIGEKQPGVVAYASNPSIQEAERGGSGFPGQPQLLSEALCNLVRPCFK